MDANGVKNAIFFTAGLCIGGGTAYILVKKRYRLLAEEEIESVREAFQRINEVKTRQAVDDWTSQPISEKDVAQQKSARIVDKAQYITVSNEEPENVVVARHEVDDSARQIVEVDIDAEEDHIEVRVSQHERNPKAPYEIDATDFYGSELDNISLTYWVEDEMLVDERDSQVEDVDSTIGLHILERIKEDPDDEATIYVCNERLEAVFEIQKSPGSFSETLINPNDANTHWEDKRPKLKRSDG